MEIIDRKELEKQLEEINFILERLKLNRKQYVEDYERIGSIATRQLLGDYIAEANCMIRRFIMKISGLKNILELNVNAIVLVDEEDLGGLKNGKG